MSLRVERIRQVSDEEWDRTWQACDYATFFHGREWAEIWRSYTRGRMRPIPCIVEMSDGTSALVPLSCQRSWTSKWRFSSPASTYGGWLSSTDLGPSHAHLLTKLLTNGSEGIVWRINPYDPSACSLEPPGCQPDATHVLDLSLGFAALRGRWTRGHRYAENKARRVGITVRRASTTSDWKRYYAVYQSTLRRWGSRATSRYGWRLFQGMARRRSANLSLWLAELPGVGPVAGTVALYARDHVVVWHGAALAEHFPLKATNLLYVEVMKDAEESGRRWFDFNPSGGHVGVERFKRHFGAEARSCPLLFRPGKRGALGTIVDSLLRPSQQRSP